MICPLCGGKQILPVPVGQTAVQAKQEIVRRLVKLGYSYRQIMKMVGYKSISSVQSALQEGKEL